MGFNCLGEELNFLTTIFSRTLYHLSYRDLIFNFKNFKTRGRCAAPDFDPVGLAPPGQKVNLSRITSPEDGDFLNFLGFKTYLIQKLYFSS